MTGWGARIKSVLKGLTTFKYANAKELLGRHQSTVFEYEKEIRTPDIEFLAKLSNASGVSIDWLADGKGPQMRGLDRSALETALRTTFKIVESAKRQNKTYPQDEIVSFACDIYEEIINAPLDESATSTDSEHAVHSDGDHDAKNRKANS